jgi:hypothetical protein
MDLRVGNGEPSSPALTCPRATISFRGFTQLFLQPCITACWWLNPVMSAFEAMPEPPCHRRRQVARP